MGILVATLDYLYNIENYIEQPIIVEKEKLEATRSIATTDSLTGLYARDVFETYLKNEIKKMQREKKELYLLMIDIDDFKKINDKFGHQEGDSVLKKIGHIIKKTIRAYDIATRYGGEEISIIMPDINHSNAILIAERIRKKIYNTFSDYKYEVTVSIGMSSLQKNDKNFSLLKKADSALYAAKKRGKNMVVNWEKNIT